MDGRLKYQFMINYYNMSLESTVSIAKVGTNSVRATVPEGIVAFLDLKVGDKLIWKMEVLDNKERIAIITKKRNHQSSKSSLNYVRPKRVVKDD
jgi:hypothetical protein